MLKTTSRLLIALIIGTLAAVALYLAAQPGVRFADHYYALEVGMNEDNVIALFGRPPDYACVFKESKIVYYSREPLKRRLPGEAPDVAPYVAAIPWIAGAVQILLDKNGRVKAFTWNGEEYVKDNNLLPKSEKVKRDVEDYYLLHKPLVEKDGKYSLLLKEFEQEHDFFDQVRLFVVDHDPSFKIAIDPNGRILTYKNPLPPVSAVTTKERMF